MLHALVYAVIVTVAALSDGPVETHRSVVSGDV